MYHSSPVEIKEITNGLFGSGLFFGSSDCCGWGSFVYEIEDSADIKVCTTTHLYREINETEEPEVVAFAKKWEIDVETAFDIITERKSSINIINEIDSRCDGEAGWEAQKIALILAMKLGFDAVKLFDENGTVWLVNGHVAIKKWREI